jgi:hypothetical protein
MTRRPHDERDHREERQRQGRRLATGIWHFSPQLSASLIACGLGIFLGMSLVYVSGLGFRPEAPHAVWDGAGNNAGVGRIEVIQMPVGGRRLEDVKSFLMTKVSYDDFGKVYVNNYLVNASEDRHRILLAVKDNDKESKDFQETNARGRNNEFPLPKDVTIFLRRGTNHIVYEVENATGACTGEINFLVNNIELKAFPQYMPNEDFQPDLYTANEVLRAQLKEQKMDFVDNALCSRRIWQFSLD